MKLGKFFGCLILSINFVSAVDDAAQNKSAFGSILDIFRRPAPQTNVAVATPTNPPPGTISSAPLNPAAAALASIPTDELTAGLRQALSNGLTRAVANLGRTNGFLTNVNVCILMPAQLAKTEKTLRKLGQGPVVDEFIASMNHAAEQAVPAATGVFIGAVTQISIADARALLASPSKTAITEYFRKTTTNQLAADFLPIVKDATAKVGVTAAYKQLEEKIPFGAALFSNTSLDLDQYVTGKALDGLFVMVGDEEKRIRENPQARVTSLLEKVFGALSK